MVIVHRPDMAVLTLLAEASAARSRAEAASSLLSSSPVSLRAASRTLADRLCSRHGPLLIVSAVGMFLAAPARSTRSLASLAPQREGSQAARSRPPSRPRRRGSWTFASRALAAPSCSPAAHARRRSLRLARGAAARRVSDIAGHR
ncbi:hypothetical protein PsYK624_119360 [Phanerochaete sordida]|uniref:Uncharacterized protein n=1 Tax=Phanerochaete sordida TaxID=48140 RepID=A0A9P3GLP4_9APHY|nr:hypothetical protein PsYK624_119360 [Phanerochaete sordida]